MGEWNKRLYPLKQNNANLNVDSFINYIKMRK